MRLGLWVAVMGRRQRAGLAGFWPDELWTPMAYLLRDRRLGRLWFWLGPSMQR
jgi:hypothetical protein